MTTFSILGFLPSKFHLPAAVLFGLLGFLVVVNLTTAKFAPKEKSAPVDIPILESSSCPKTPPRTEDSGVDNEALKKAKQGVIGTVETPAGRRSTRIAIRQAATPKTNEKRQAATPKTKE